MRFIKDVTLTVYFLDDDSGRIISYFDFDTGGHMVDATMESTTREPPDIAITVRSTPNHYWMRTPRTYPPPSAAEIAAYYKTYDPMVGMRIVAALSGFFTVAVLYVIYKVTITVSLTECFSLLTQP